MTGRAGQIAAPLLLAAAAAAVWLLLPADTHGAMPMPATPGNVGLPVMAAGNGAGPAVTLAAVVYGGSGIPPAGLSVVETTAGWVFGESAAAGVTIPVTLAYPYGYPGGSFDAAWIGGGFVPLAGERAGLLVRGAARLLYRRLDRTPLVRLEPLAEIRTAAGRGRFIFGPGMRSEPVALSGTAGFHYNSDRLAVAAETRIEGFHGVESVGGFVSMMMHVATGIWTGGQLRMELFPDRGVGLLGVGLACGVRL